MALQPAIALGYQPPQIRTSDPSETLVRGMQLKQMAQGMELNQARAEQERMQTEEMKRKRDEALKVREILMNEPDPVKALPKVYAVSPEAANALSDHLNKRQKEQRDAEFQQLTSNAKKLDMMSGIAGTMKDQATYDAGIGRALNLGLITPEQYAQLPKEWTPDTQKLVGQFADQVMSAKEQHDLALKQAAEKRAAEEAAAKLPGEKAKSYAERLAVAAQLMGSATTPEQYVSRYNTIDPDLRPHFIPEFSADATSAATQLGLSAKEAVAASQKQTEQAETKRYHDETIRTRDDRNAISREGNGVQDRFNKRMEQKAHDDAVKERDKYGRQVQEGQQEIDKFNRRKAILDGDIARYEQVLKDNPEGMLGANKARKEALQKMEDAKKEHASIVKQQQEIKDRMNEAQRKKDEIKVGASGEQPTGASGARPRARNPKTGEVVEFDGKSWVPVKE